MPTYGYRCPKGHEFEAVHGMGAPPPTACEVCGAAPVSRVFYPISTSFTGTGFYSTDYGQGEQKPEPATPAGDSVKVLDEGAKKTDEKTTKKPNPSRRFDPLRLAGPRSNCVLRRMRLRAERSMKSSDDGGSTPTTLLPSVPLYQLVGAVTRPAPPPPSPKPTGDGQQALPEKEGRESLPVYVSRVLLGQASVITLGRSARSAATAPGTG